MEGVNEMSDRAESETRDRAKSEVRDGMRIDCVRVKSTFDSCKPQF